MITAEREKEGDIGTKVSKEHQYQRARTSGTL